MRAGGERTVRYTEDSFRRCGGGTGGPGMERAQFRAILRIVDTSYEKSAESVGTSTSVATRLACSNAHAAAFNPPLALALLQCSRQFAEACSDV